MSHHQLVPYDEIQSWLGRSRGSDAHIVVGKHVPFRKGISKSRFLTGDNYRVLDPALQLKVPIKLSAQPLESFLFLCLDEGKREVVESLVTYGTVAWLNYMLNRFVISFVVSAKDFR